jgi:hypothetical protein
MADTDRHAEHPGGRHEEHDVQVRPIVIFGLGLIILTTVVLLLMDWMFDYLAAYHARLDVPRSPLSISREPPPGPRLEVSPDQTLRELRTEEEAVLHSYGWVDRDAGIVRLPIDRAITLLTERGLPRPTEDRGSKDEDRDKKKEH